MGTCPPLLHNNPDTMVSQKKISEEIVDPQSDEVVHGDKHAFGLIIVGLTGTGKTTSVTNLCNVLSEGILYYKLKIYSTGLARALASNENCTKT